MSPLYKYTLTPPCCHSTEQCSSAKCEQKNCTNIQTLKLSSVIGGTGKQEQDRKESKAIVEWPYRLSLWQGHWWILGTHAHNHNTPRYTKKSSTLTRRVCRWRQCSFLRLSFLWKLHKFVSPSDAWPAWTWPSDYLKHTHVSHILPLHTHTWHISDCRVVKGSDPVELLTSKVSSDDVGNDSPRPDSFEPGCGCSRNTTLHSLTSFPGLALWTGRFFAFILGDKV